MVLTPLAGFEMHTRLDSNNIRQHAQDVLGARLHGRREAISGRPLISET
jgi:hypothetical protein